MDTAQDTTPDEEKRFVCTKCGEEKLVGQFYRDKSRKGHDSQCKQCISLYQKQRRAANPDRARAHNVKNYARHQEARRAYAKKYRAKHPEQIKAANAKWQAEHKEERKQYNTYYRITHQEEIHTYYAGWYAKHGAEKVAHEIAWRAENLEEARFLDRKYYAAHASHERGKKQRRRAILANSVCIETFTDEEIFERDRWICSLCHGKVSKKLKWPDGFSPSIDHLIPLSQGGHHTRQNCVLVHLRCNTSKGVRAIPQQQRLF